MMLEWQTAVTSPFAFIDVTFKDGAKEGFSLFPLKSQPRMTWTWAQAGQRMAHPSTTGWTLTPGGCLRKTVTSPNLAQLRRLDHMCARRDVPRLLDVVARNRCRRALF